MRASAKSAAGSPGLEEMLAIRSSYFFLAPDPPRDATARPVSTSAPMRLHSLSSSGGMVTCCATRESKPREVRISCSVVTTASLTAAALNAASLSAAVIACDRTTRLPSAWNFCGNARLIAKANTAPASADRMISRLRLDRTPNVSGRLRAVVPFIGKAFVQQVD